MASRRKGRILAFQALYSWDIQRGLRGNASIPEGLLDFSWAEGDTPLDGEAAAFPGLLVTGTVENIADVDNMIQKHLENWELSRLNKVDLAVLRMSVYTLMFQSETPPSVVIDEAVEICREFGSDDSYRFVNGVLDSVRKNLNEKNKLPGNPLKLVSVAGLILALIISWGMLLFALFRGDAGNTETFENSFARELRTYDLLDAPKLVIEGENPGQIERMLSRLQRNAKSAEEQLSVLKRRRALALIDRRYISAYAQAAKTAAETFAYSTPIAAVAAEAITLGGVQTEDDLALLKSYASRISQYRFDTLALSANVLAGEMDNPARAAALPILPDMLSLDLSGFSEKTKRDLLVDEFLLRAYSGDISSATSIINYLLNTGEREITTMGAEFFYDHDNPLRAAELFLSLDDENDYARAADALALAGELSGARNIWLALSAGSQSGLSFRYLYNLASSAPDQTEEESWLERLFLQTQRTRTRQGPLDSLSVYSVIKYTRLLDSSRSIAVLEDIKGYPLLNLELLRRRQPEWPPTRATAEVWVLLGSSSDDADLYEWAAWYFEHQRLYPELTRLLKEASRKGMNGSWFDLHTSLALIRDGKISEAEKILDFRFRDPSSSDWRIAANLGRIRESRRAISSALEYYHAAAALVKDKPSAALVQLRLARCFEALGRMSESYRAVELAYELDSGNINVRREFRRIEGR
jgi:N utilization substance protein B